MLELNGLSKEYEAPAGRLRVLDRITLRVERGQSLAVMGPSGSGKSTLLSLMGVLETPSAGELRILGANPFSLGEAEQARFRNRHIGFVFQEHGLLAQCTVLENVLVPTLVGEAQPDREGRARDLLARVGLEGRLGHFPGQLSGGEKQRVAIARALIRQPELLLCDEPTGNLDRRTAESVAELLLELHGHERTVLVVATHSERLAAKVGEIHHLADGRLERR